jgi:hypothetical protein
VVGVDAIAIGLVVLFVAWIVDQQSIGSGRTTNDNAIHGMVLMFRAFEVSVFFHDRSSRERRVEPKCAHHDPHHEQVRMETQDARESYREWHSSCEPRV